MATEWDEAQQRIGNQPKDNTPTLTEGELLSIVEKVAERYESASKEDRMDMADSLDELEGLESDEDDEFLRDYRAKRMAALKGIAAKKRMGLFGSLREISGAAWKPEVTDASEKHHVVVMLYKDRVPGCDVMSACLEKLAQKFPNTKFVKTISDSAIPGYPDHLLPTLIVYFKGDVASQITGLKTLGGLGCTADDVEWALSKIGAVETDLTEHPRLAERAGIRFKSSGYLERTNEMTDDLS
eukprot:CAMPEP_0177660774 /NCGR_PEP_ID=MMETSP0447-20121125/18250_1 /TAXON_ID=0 /ORGANISM="Stygamoeba regulata, Strain BSH-02190019" /LENGTH=240 /DNA_ID=CAMNT_0019165923 /DNA_START=39 /DNA_END=761 /DNA_ORIENTATION=-